MRGGIVVHACICMHNYEILTHGTATVSKFARKFPASVIFAEVAISLII